MRICFEAFTLDLDTRQLIQSGREIHLAPKAFALLATLVQVRPKALSKAELQQHLWPDTFVVEANLSSLVAEIRAALGDLPRSPRFVRTVHGFGYAFCAAGEVGVDSPAVERTARWLEWGRRRFPLEEGAHVIGRDPDAGVRLDASTVSRHHARLVVTGAAATLEDSGSKNGTFRGTTRVTAAIPLADGDAIHIGSVLVIYHATDQPLSTVTQTRTEH